MAFPMLHRFIFTLFCLVILQGRLSAQDNNYLWVDQTGGTSTDVGNDITTDKDNNVIVTGSFSGRVEFGNYVLSSEGSEDMFLMKYDSKGEVLWAKSVGGFYKDYGNSVATDAQGNIYVCGTFQSVVYFEDFVLSSQGDADVFVAKYDKHGNIQWAKRGGGVASDWGQGIAVDKQGNVYTTGKFNKKADFGKDTLVSQGEEDLFVVKYDPAGNVLWARGAGGNMDNRGNDLAIDPQNNIYLTGSSRGWMSLDGHEVFSDGLNDMFLAKLSPDGKFEWAKTGGGEGYDFGFALATDPHGNIYLTGCYNGRATFDGNTLISKGNLDVFVAKYSPRGQLLWIRSGGGTDEDYAGSVYTDKEGNIYATGEFRGIATFGSHSLKSKGNWDIYLIKYDPKGNTKWVQRAGEAHYDRGSAISGDQENNVLITGHFEVGAAFDKNAIQSKGKEDVFVTKMSQFPSNPVATYSAVETKTIKPDAEAPEKPKPDDDGLIIYPNPNGGEFELSWKSNVVQKVKVVVDDPTGKVYFSQRETLKIGHNSFDIKIDNIPAGYYTVRLIGRKHEYKAQLIIR